jgi:hypothetical protein
MDSQTCIQIHIYLFIAISKYIEVKSNSFNHCRPNEHEPEESAAQELQHNPGGTRINVSLGTHVYIQSIPQYCCHLVTHHMPRWQTTLQNIFILKILCYRERFQTDTHMGINYLQFLQINVQTSSDNFFKQHHKQNVRVCTVLIVIQCKQLPVMYCRTPSS